MPATPATENMHTHIYQLYTNTSPLPQLGQTYQSLAMLYAYKTNACFRNLQFPPQAAKASVMQQLQYGINSLSKFAIARVLILTDI